MSNKDNKDISLALDFFGGDEFAATTYINKYALRDKENNLIERDPRETISRVMLELADSMPEEKTLDAFYDEWGNPTRKLSCPTDEWLKRVFGEKEFNSRSIDSSKRATWFEVFREACNEFKGVCPQGSVISAAGNYSSLQSLSNCFVIDSPADNIGGILKASEEMAQIFKRRGGAGICISTLRPDGSPVLNAARTSSGAVGFMDLFSNVGRSVGQNSRRAALMITLDIKHPDALKFARAKLNREYCTGANVSLKISDEFMRAVKEGTTFTQQFPVDSDNPSITQDVDARGLWEEIIKCAHECAEPGILLWDNTLRNLPAHCYRLFKTIAPNPCAELSLSAYDSCRLLSINLIGYIVNPFQEDCYFDFKKFERDIRIATRMSDAVVSAEIKFIERLLVKLNSEEKASNVEYDLWVKIKNSAEQGRRIGLGTHGLGDCLAQLRLKYDSEEALGVVDKIYTTLRNTAYDESVEMAKDYGSFPIFDWELEKSCEFIKRLPKGLRDKIKEHGRRNISLLTNAPTGTLAIMSQCSSGIEPTFRFVYMRRRKINQNDSNSRVDFIDELGDKWMEFPQFDHNVKTYFEAMKLDLPDVKTEAELVELLPEYFITSDKINWESRVELQSRAQINIDHSISSCLAGEKKHLIATNRGAYYIEDLALGVQEGKFEAINSTKELKVTNHLGEEVTATEAYNNGKIDCLEVELNGHVGITATPNHRLYCLDKDYNGVWKRVDTIKEGDFIIKRTGLSRFGDSQRTISDIMGEFKSALSPTKGNTKEIKLPKRVSTDLARFLGYIISDGSVSTNGVILSQLTNNVVEDFKQLCFNLFNIECSVSQDKRTKGLLSISANSRVLRDFCEYLGITKSCHTKTVPRIILQGAGRYQTAEFIKGLTLDGHVSVDRLTVMTTASKQLALEIVYLLNEFGIKAGIYIKKGGARKEYPNSKGKKYLSSTCYEVSCCRDEGSKFIQYIGFAEDRKKEESFNKFKIYPRRQVSGVIPDNGLRKRFRQEVLPNIKSNKLYEMLYSMSHSTKDKFHLTRENLRCMADLGLTVPSILLDYTYSFEKVKNVRPAGTYNTYDISVPDGNSYTVNGIISHNTINLPKDASVEEVKKIYESAYEKGLKGVTVYREGSRDGVLISQDEYNKSSKERPEKIERAGAPKRPKRLPCEVHFTVVKGEEYVVIVGLLQGAVYEVFFGKYRNQIPKKQFNGYVEKKSKGKYLLTYIEDVDVKQIDINDYFDNDDYVHATRLLSMSLRHGVPLDYVIEQLHKSSSSIVEFGAAMSRILKKYIKIEDLTKSHTTCKGCGSTNIVLKYEDGCVSVVCNVCSLVDSKCG